MAKAYAITLLLLISDSWVLCMRYVHAFVYIYKQEHIRGRGVELRGTAFDLFSNFHHILPLSVCCT